MTKSTSTTEPNAPGTEPFDVFEQFTAKTIEGFGLWAEANQKVLQNLVDLSTTTASEGVKVYAELQTSAVQAVKGGQEFLLRPNRRLKDVQKDPFGSYQKNVLESFDGAQKAFKLIEASAETVTKSAERLQESAELASRDIQATFATLGNRLKALYTPA
jgi:hypothetical protein